MNLCSECLNCALVVLNQTHDSLALLHDRILHGGHPHQGGYGTPQGAQPQSGYGAPQLGAYGAPQEDMQRLRAASEVSLSLGTAHPAKVQGAFGGQPPRMYREQPQGSCGGHPSGRVLGDATGRLRRPVTVRPAAAWLRRPASRRQGAYLGAPVQGTTPGPCHARGSRCSTSSYPWTS